LAKLILKGTKVMSLQCSFVTYVFDIFKSLKL
jgi:hypothetical protein